MTKKYVNFFFSALLALCVIAACDDKDDDTPTMTISSNSVTIQATGGEESVEITTNQAEWNATHPELDSWCTLKKEGNVLKISATANETIIPRSTLITVTAGVGIDAKTQEIKVNQIAAEPYLEIANTPVELDAAGTAVELTVTSNTAPWTATCPDEDSWCKLQMDGDKLTISAEAYTVNAERTTTITVTAGEGTSTVTKTFGVSQQGAAPIYAIEIPTSFDDGDVQKVLYQNVKVAEICYEYIRTGDTDERMVVIYPVTDEGKADLSKGFAVKNGGSIVWNVEDNTCTYTAGAESTLSKVYLEEGKFSATTTAASTITTTVKADLLTDNRPGDTPFEYKIVKIGTQYWMAENLKAQKYLNGSDIDYITDATEWKNTKNGAYRLPFSDTQSFLTFGAFYNGYTMFNEAGLAPKDWMVPSNTEWNKLSTYLGTRPGEKMKSTSASYWKTGAGTNISGFNAISGGEYTAAGGETNDGKEVYYWSTTTEPHWLTKIESPYYYRLATTTASLLKDTHTHDFGHYIRCVRK